MFVLDMVSISQGVGKDGNPFSIYRLFYRDVAKRAFFCNFYDSSPVIIGGETLCMADAVSLISRGAKFDVYDGPNGSKVFSFLTE